jgi:hypothetical protein
MSSPRSTPVVTRWSSAPATPARASPIPVAPERCVARFEDLTVPRRAGSPSRRRDAVVNCVGILRERGRATYERVHLVAPAAHCGGVRHAQDPSPRARVGAGPAHRCAEPLRPLEAARRGRAEACRRPEHHRPASLLEGPEATGRGGCDARRVAVHLVAGRRHRPHRDLDVRDVASAIAVLCGRPPPRRVECVEFGGRTSFRDRRIPRMLRQSSASVRPAGPGVAGDGAARRARVRRAAPHAVLVRSPRAAAARQRATHERPGRACCSARCTASRARSTRPSGWDSAREAAWSDAATPH